MDLFNSQREDGTNGPLRVAFATMGCRSNYADTVDLQAALVDRGAVPCDFESAADVYVINTCTVTDAADRSAYKLIKKARSRAPNARIVVTGCLAEVGEEGLRELGMIDEVVGPGRRERTLQAIFGTAQAETPGMPVEDLPEAYPNGRRAKRNSPNWRSISLDGELSAATAGPGEYLGEVKSRARYHLRIQEGCENSCTFCIIPHSRGRFSSRSLEDILGDIKRLVDLGYQELVLTGTHLGGWGIDRGSSFVELIQAISKISAPCRIRLSSIDPNDVTADLIDLLSECNVFCPHLHICVQAFSDKTLKRMNRRYSLDEAVRIVNSVFEKIPGVCIGSDVITGFPGETRKEVEQAIEVFLVLPISYLHVFPYSERAGTAATRLEGAVPVKERKRRAARWRALAERKRAEFCLSCVGREVETVIEQISDDFAFGTTAEFASAKIARGALIGSDQGDFRLGSRVRRTVKSYDEEDGYLLCQ